MDPHKGPFKVICDIYGNFCSIYFNIAGMGPRGYSEKIRVGGGGVFRSEVKYFRGGVFRFLNIIKIYTVQVG